MDLTMSTSLIRRPLMHLAEAWRGLWSGPITSTSPELARLWASPPTSTGVAVSEQTALTYAPFWDGISLISADVASLPLIHYQRLPSGGKQRYNDSKLYRILHDEPNPEMSAMTMRETMQSHLLTWGNAYAEIERDQMGRALYLWPLTPDRVQPIREKYTNALIYQVTEFDGHTTTIAAADMLHVPGLGYDGLLGYSVIAKARESIGLGLAMERFGGTFFGNGATFGGIISYKGPRPTEMSDINYRDVLNARHQGVDRAHKLLALYNDATYTRIGIPPEDAQFLESRKFQIEDMCRWLHLPPHKLKHLDRSTNNNIEHQGIEYGTDCLRHWCVRWEQEINRKLIFKAERRIQFVEHVLEGVMRGDQASRYAAYAVGRQWGWLSVDDVREKENMNPLPNGQGQIYLVPTNMAPADRLNEIIDKQVAPDPAPQPPATADPAVAAANARAEAAEQSATVAREQAQIEREARIAAETTGTATAEELRVLRESEGRSTALSVQVTALAEELRIRADALQAAQAEHVRLTTELATEQASRAAAEAQATTIEQARAADMAAARAALAGAEQRATAEAEARATESAAAATERDAEQRRRTGVIGAHRGLIADAMGRMIRRETEKARRAQATPEKLRSWIDTFYPVHEDICRAALLPAMRAHVAWTQGTDDPVALTVTFVKQHIDESIRQLRVVLESEPEDVPMTLETTLRHWELERADALADVILREEIEYVRHQR